MTHLALDFPPALWLGLPLAVAVVVVLTRAQFGRGLAPWQVATLSGLRGSALLTLVFLAARPTWVVTEEPSGERRSVVLLLDRSESMALEDHGQLRLAQALKLARDELLPSLKAAGLRAQALLFADEAQPADGPQLAAAVADGKRTNLAGAIAHALQNTEKPPLSVIALTDGAATENSDNARALAALLDERVPFVGIGFGSETGVRTITLQQASAPPAVPAKQQFRASAQLETTGEGELPPFELLLLRDGQFHQKKTVRPGKGARIWLEGFDVAEDEEGVHTYTVQLLPPSVPGLKCTSNLATAAVRISDEQEVRVLFAQGALTWNYKFVNLALRDDPTLKLTGISRTSHQSVYYQNVENAVELTRGFPTRLEELAPFRVAVLSNLKPADLTSEQQDLLARFCGEYGGGVLMIGGSETFDGSWQRSRLEQLLPVRFATVPGPPGPPRPFRLRLTEEALQHPVFQVTDGGADRAAWGRLPTFLGYGRVDAAKPGARVWMQHSDDVGPDGRRILMATQRFGSGLSAVLCVPNLWRWRLDKDSDPQQFDRFWRQLLRYLSEGSREHLAIRFPDQDLRPRSELRAVVERRPDPKNTNAGSHPYLVRVEDGAKQPVLEQAIALAPSRSVDVAFRAEAPGVYAVSVLDSQSRFPLASRTVEVKETNVEFEHATRDMENLRQWASLTEGVALKAEDCTSTNDLIATLKKQAEQARPSQSRRLPAGVNGWTLLALFGLLGAEWVLRKRWDLT